MLKQKHLLLFIISFIYSIGVYAGNEEAPRILLFFGRFHPLLLHLPIGALLLTFFMEIVGRIRKNKPHIMIVNALAFSAFFSVLTAILGYFLSLEGGYGKEVIQIHMYSGFGMALLTCLLFIVKKKENGKFKKTYLPLYIATLLLTIVTGHYGSILTHGDTFLTTYSPLELEGNQEIIVETDSLYYYKHVITPILEDKCIQCHNSNKTKGELNLSTINHINKGGENGSVFKAGNALESSMFTALLLPIEEDEHMPPTGKSQLTRNEIWLIKHWIDTGADFNKQSYHYKHNDTLSNLLKDYLIFPKINIDEASFKDIKRLTEHGFAIRNLIFGEPYLSATYSNNGRKISKIAMNSLTEISDQLVELNLQESKLSDELSGSIAELKTLRILRLDKTLITDNSLENLKSLNELEVLNLFNTNITADGLSELLNYIKPKKVFFGSEDREKMKSTSLNNDFNETTVFQSIQEGFLERTKLEKPVILGNKFLFEKELKIEVMTRLDSEKVYYTLNGNDPDSTSLLYTEPIIIYKPLLFKTKTYKEGWFSSDIVERGYTKVKYEFKEVSTKYPPREIYTGVNKLIDLERGSNQYKDGNWVGFPNDLVATLDLGKERDFSQLTISCLENVNGHVFFPLHIEIFAGNDLNKLKQIGKLKLPASDRKSALKFKEFNIDFEQVHAQYITVFMKMIKVCPKWHPRAGQVAYIYVDEIMILE